jgi:hypothetical protein
MEYEPREPSKRYGWRYLRPESLNCKDYQKEVNDARNRDYADSVQNQLKYNLMKKHSTCKGYWW